jgi:hypothetical protein
MEQEWGLEWAKVLGLEMEVKWDDRSGIMKGRV